MSKFKNGCILKSALKMSKCGVDLKRLLKYHRHIAGKKTGFAEFHSFHLCCRICLTSASCELQKLFLSKKNHILLMLNIMRCTVKLLSPLTCSFCVHWCWYCTDAKLWDLFAGKQYNVLLIFKFLINYSPLSYISLSFFVYLSSDVSGLRSPGVQLIKPIQIIWY